MMDLAFLNTLTNAQRAALAILAEDLQNFGVTDSMGADPIGLTNMVKAAELKPAPQITPRMPPKTTSKITSADAPKAAATALLDEILPEKAKQTAHLSPTPEAKRSNKPFALEEHLHVIEGTLPFTVVTSATDGHNLWEDAEEILWQNMMKAIGFEGQNPTFQLLVGAAANDTQLPPNHEASLRGAMLEKLPLQPILVMGHRGLQILSAGQGHAAAVRRKEWQLKMPENSAFEGTAAQKNAKEACFFALVATYHCHTLLRQPFLKRQTWADLLTLKQILEEGQV